MMMMCSQYLFDPTERADIARLRRVYKLYCNGLFKTCHYDEAVKLLITGKWFDKTTYLPNEEVLTYEKPRQRICSDQSKTSSERQESGHQQYQPNTQNNCGEELPAWHDGSRSAGSEVKKRGRPKVIK